LNVIRSVARSQWSLTRSSGVTTRNLVCLLRRSLGRTVLRIEWSSAETGEISWQEQLVKSGGCDVTKVQVSVASLVVTCRLSFCQRFESRKRCCDVHRESLEWWFY